MVELSHQAKAFDTYAVFAAFHLIFLLDAACICECLEDRRLALTTLTELRAAQARYGKTIQARAIAGARTIANPRAKEKARAKEKLKELWLEWRENPDLYKNKNRFYRKGAGHLRGAC